MSSRLSYLLRSKVQKVHSLLIAISLWPAVVVSGVVVNPADRIVDLAFSGHVDPEFEFFDEAPHGILAPWADSSIPVEGRVRYLFSTSLDYLFEEVPRGPAEFQTNYYLNQGTPHVFRMELQIGSIELTYDLATAPEFSAGIIILIQDAGGQAAALFNDTMDLTPLLPYPVYHTMMVQLIDETAPFGLFLPEQLSSPYPPAFYPELAQGRGSLYISDFSGGTGASALAFVIDEVVIVPEPAAPLLSLTAFFALFRRRRAC